jgi:hypothetical protein
VAAELPRRHPAGGDQLAGGEVVGHLGLELVGGVAVAVADDDLVARKEKRPPAVPELEPLVLSELVHSGQHEIAGPGPQLAGQKPADRIVIDVPGGVGELDAPQAVGREGGAEQPGRPGPERIAIGRVARPGALALVE